MSFHVYQDCVCITCQGNDWKIEFDQVLSIEKSLTQHITLCIHMRIRALPAPRYFLQSLGGFFVITLKNYKLLFEVELIINNAPLTYVQPNTIETCLTPNHLLFGRQLLYSSNIRSTVVRNLTLLSSTAGKIKSISNHFFGQVEK